MRDRMTQRRNRKPVAAKGILAEIEELEAQIAGMDEELEADADALASAGWGTDENYGCYDGDEGYGW